jgi:hypothetical protein
MEKKSDATAENQKEDFLPMIAKSRNSNVTNFENLRLEK